MKPSSRERPVFRALGVWSWSGSRWLAAVAALMTEVCSAHTFPEYADTKQRTEVAAIQSEFCAAKQRPRVEAPSVEYEVWSDAVRRAKTPSDVVDSTMQALDLARDVMGQGQAAETWNLLCDVIAARSRYLGKTAPRTIQIYVNFAVLLRKEGRIADARRILQLLEPIVRKYPPEGANSARSVVHNLATTLSQQGYYEQAEATFQRALTLGHGLDMTSTQTNLAWTLEAQEKWKESEKIYLDVLEIRRAAGPARRLELAATLTNLGRNLTNQGRDVDGEKDIREGLDLRRKLLPKGHLNIGYSLSALVQNLMQQHRYQDALPLTQELVALRLKALGLRHSETVEAYKLHAETQLKVNAISEALVSARTALEGSVGLVDREAASVSDPARTISRGSTADAALTFVRVAWAADESGKTFEVEKVPAVVEESFLAAQRAHTSSTAEALLSASARSRAKGATSQSLVQQYEVGVAKRAQLDGDLADAAAAGRPIGKLQTAMSEVSSSTAKVKEELRAAYPAYFDLIRPEPASVKAVAQTLKDGEVFLIMLPGNAKDEGFIWAVTRSELAWAQVPGTRKSLLRDINALRRLLDPGNKYIDDTGPMPLWSVAHDLYQILFAAPQIAKLASSSEHWMLAPHGVLVSLPFSALLLSAPQNLAPRPQAASLRNQRWLGLSKDLTVVPSAAGLLALRKAAIATSRHTRPFFGLGDPYFSDSKAAALFEVRPLRSVSKPDLQTLRELDPLPGTRAEILGLAKLLGASSDSYLLGKGANEPALTRRIANNQLQDARVLAFATHGLMGSELESISEPALVLTPPDKVTVTDDGLLTSSDVSRLNLRADLVLLSACNTAAGVRPGMEGMTGLARSFLFAGAKSLLISHWRVSDEVAPRISTKLVELSRTGQRSTSGAAAIRRAMLEVFNDTSRDEDDSKSLAHPSAWAAFAYVGAD